MNNVNYVGCTLGLVTRKMIAELYDTYNIPKENQVNLDDIHITIFKSFDLFQFNDNKSDLLEALDNNTVEIDYWTPKGNQMVLKVKSQFCDDIFESLKKNTKPIYEDYISHITIARDLPEDVLNKLPVRNTKIDLKYYPIITSIYSSVI